MLKAYKYRLYPNNIQKEQIGKTFGCCRFVYNQMLAKRIDDYKQENKSMSKIDMNNYCNRVIKKEFEWLKEVDKWALTNSIYNLDEAYKNFFRRVKQGQGVGFPKFKSKKNRRNSYKTNFSNGNIKVDFTNNKIQLPKLKWIKAKVHREFVGKIKSATISHAPSGKYFVSILVDTENVQLPKLETKVGIDLGLNEFAITSDGEVFDNPKWLRKQEQKLKKAQRNLSRKKKGSKNREKARIKVAKIHEKIANQRKDYLHKISSYITNENQVIVIEDLKVSNMMSNHKLAKAIGEVSWYEFRIMLEYKCKWKGRQLIIAPTNYASSQLCSNCGNKSQQTKDLSCRTYVCEKCGMILDRDINASINLLKLAM